MPLYQVILLAVVQGFTEFLPISSSAHLALAPWLLGWKDQGLTFDIALHIGTLLAVLIYFFRDWLQVVAHGFGLPWNGDPELRANPKLLWLLAAASLPIGLLGLLFKEQAETVFRSPFIIGTMLVVIGLLMLAGEHFGRRVKDVRHVSFLDAMVIGAAQALAIVPGTSRSGITITAGLFRDLDRAAAARFSFLLSTPAVLAAGLKAVADGIKDHGAASFLSTEFIVGVSVSALTGCLVIAFFLRFLKRNSLHFFIYYRIVFGIIVLALAFFRQQAG
ncbi:MAG: undecaprenyl-diphosphatase UppP [Bryobacter sp.]|nr:undecaprenyl-diphosphatase UppP [Bryobacter sp.]